MLETILALKPPCPRDLGIWYCEECIKQSEEESFWADRSIDPVGCGQEEGNKICGTHLGYSYCEGCTASGQNSYKSHYSEYIVVATVGE